MARRLPTRKPLLVTVVTAKLCGPCRTWAAQHVQRWATHAAAGQAGEHVVWRKKQLWPDGAALCTGAHHIDEAKDAKKQSCE